MAKRKKQAADWSQPDKDAKTKALYAKMRKKFSAGDLQKYTEVEDGVPAELVIKEMERLYQEFKRKRK